MLSTQKALSNNELERNGQDGQSVCVCVVIWSLLLLYFFARRPRGVEEQQMRVNGVSLLERREKVLVI